MEAERIAGILAVLQHADTMFPSGSVSFSWGLEALFNRGMVTSRDTLAEFVSAQIRGRWANLDRVMMVHAHGAGDDLQKVARLDMLMEAQSLSAEQRLGSSRMGAAFLATHRRLGSPLAEEYMALTKHGEAYGHVALMQGLIWGQLGFSAIEIQPMSAHCILTSLLGAAVRLSIIGHIDAQAIHSDLLPLVAGFLSEPVCNPEECHSFIPQIEIASMNHETDEVRLFVN